MRKALLHELSISIDDENATRESLEKKLAPIQEMFQKGHFVSCSNKRVRCGIKVVNMMQRSDFT